MLGYVCGCMVIEEWVGKWTYVVCKETGAWLLRDSARKYYSSHLTRS